LKIGKCMNQGTMVLLRVEACNHNYTNWSASTWIGAQTIGDVGHAVVYGCEAHGRYSCIYADLPIVLGHTYDPFGQGSYKFLN